MQQYHDLIKRVLEEGAKKEDRTGTGTISVFGHQMRFDLSEGFPLVTTKKLHLKSIIHELIWFLNGDTNIKYLNDNGVRIWDEWADENGDLGPIYGQQWRSWRTVDGHAIDQISDVIDQIKNNPDSRRMLVVAFNPGDVANTPKAPPPCHSFSNFMSRTGNYRANYTNVRPIFSLGVPFNIASYALLTMMVAQVCGLKPGDFVHTFGDAHIYSNHMDQVQEQIKRKPYPLPEMHLNPHVKNIFDFKLEDFELVGYEAHPHIKGVVAV